MRIRLILISLVIISSCGQNNNILASDSIRMKPLNSADIIGDYMVTLRPINARSSGLIPSGRGFLKIGTDELHVDIEMDDGADVYHMQNIYLGQECPTTKNDLNHDNFIDIVETQRVTGPAFVPLDGDLQTQKNGSRVYPSGSDYEYSQIANLNDFIHDLIQSDNDPSDYLTKIPKDSFQLEGRVLIIHGAPRNLKLPPSVETIKGFSAQESLPIICGVIKKMK